MVTTKEDFDEYEYERQQDARWEAIIAKDTEESRFLEKDHQHHLYTWYLSSQTPY